MTDEQIAETATALLAEVDGDDVQDIPFFVDPGGVLHPPSQTGIVGATLMVDDVPIGPGWVAPEDIDGERISLVVNGGQAFDTTFEGYVTTTAQLASYVANEGASHDGPYYFAYLEIIGGLAEGDYEVTSNGYTGAGDEYGLPAGAAYEDLCITARSWEPAHPDTSNDYEVAMLSGEPIPQALLLLLNDPSWATHGVQPVGTFGALDDLDWWDRFLPAGVTESSGDVSAWASENGITLSLADSGDAPRFGDETTPSGDDAVTFTNGQRLLRRSAGATLDAPLTIVFVARMDSWFQGAGATILGNDGALSHPRIGGTASGAGVPSEENGPVGPAASQGTAAIDGPPPAADWAVVVFSYTATGKHASLTLHDGTDLFQRIAPLDGPAIDVLTLGSASGAVAFVGLIDGYTVTDDCAAIATQAADEYLAV
jgi:hypothetical protein